MYQFEQAGLKKDRKGFCQLKPCMSPVLTCTSSSGDEVAGFFCFLSTKPFGETFRLVRRVGSLRDSQPNRHTRPNRRCPLTPCGEYFLTVLAFAGFSLWPCSRLRDMALFLTPKKSTEESSIHPSSLSLRHNSQILPAL